MSQILNNRTYYGGQVKTQLTSTNHIKDWSKEKYTTNKPFKNNHYYGGEMSKKKIPVNCTKDYKWESRGY